MSPFTNQIPPIPSLPRTMTTLTVAEILESQVSLLREAAEALPHQFSQCTYALGYIRQAVYLCRTCNLTRGICSACSIACHTDHEQLELFPKRNFRCDCPTAALPQQCTLHAKTEVANTDNVYGQNFTGVFCRCGREYDAEKEMETMIQCLACEVRLVACARLGSYASCSRTGSTNRA